MSCFGFTFENTYVELPKEFYSKLSPQPVSSPKVVLLNEALAEELSLDFSESSPESLADLVSGNMAGQAIERVAADPSQDFVATVHCRMRRRVVIGVPREKVGEFCRGQMVDVLAVL